MRVALVVETYPTRSETFVRAHVEGLRAAVFSLYRGNAYDISQDPSKGFAPIISWRDRGWSESLGHKVFRRLKEVLLLGPPAPSWPRDAQQRWDALVEEYRPTVVLAEFAPNGLAALPSVRRHGLPLVTHFHGYDASSLLRQRRYRNALPMLLRESAAVIAVSRHMAGVLEGLGCPREKLHIIPCGAQLSAIPLPTQRPSVGACRFISVGRFVRVKGSSWTVRAFAHCLERTGSPCRLTMVGEGPLLQKTQRLARALGISAHVDFAGGLQHSSVLRLLSESDVYVQHSVRTSLGQIEGCPVSLAEGAATGLPSVCTRSGGIPDLINDGETGFLVAERDWKQMGERMAELANDPELRRAMGQAARAHIEQVGDAARQLGKLRALLERISAVTETRPSPARLVSSPHQDGAR